MLCCKYRSITSSFLIFWQAPTFAFVSAFINVFFASISKATAVLRKSLADILLLSKACIKLAAWAWVMWSLSSAFCRLSMPSCRHKRLLPVVERAATSPLFLPALRLLTAFRIPCLAAFVAIGLPYASTVTVPFCTANPKAMPATFSAFILYIWPPRLIFAFAPFASWRERNPPAPNMTSTLP